MELQFAKQDLNCLNRVLWEGKNQEQTLEIKLSDPMPDVGKVLGAWGQPLLRSKEWRGSGMSVSGGIQTWVLYKAEDGSGIRVVDGWIPFQIRWEFPQTQRDGAMRVSCMLRNMDARITSSRKIMVRGVVSVLAEALEPVRRELIVAEGLPEDVQLLRKRYPVCMPRESGEKNVSMEEEFQLPGGIGDGCKVLFCTVQPELNDKKIMGDKVVFRGAMLFHGMVRCADGSLQTFDREVAFSQYAELEREYDDSAEADVMLAVTDLETELAESGILRVEAALTGQYVVYDRTLLEVVEDAYSLERDVQLQTQSLSLPAVLELRRETVKACQRMEGDPGNVLDVSVMTGHPQVRGRSQEWETELSGSFQIVSVDESGELQSQIIRWENTMTDPAADAVRLLSCGSLSGHAYCEENMAKGDIALELLAVTETEIPMVTGLTLGEKKQPDPGKPSLILSNLGQESLWSLAKRCGSTVEALEKANGLQTEPEADRMLLIPVL